MLSKMKLSTAVVILLSYAVMQTSETTEEDATATCPDRFQCEYNVLLKLIKLEEKTAQQDVQLELLQKVLEDAKAVIADLNNTIVIGKSFFATTYIRWGRTTCPGDAQIVYDGYAAGSSYDHSGTAANPLCLPKDPNYVGYQSGFQTSGRIYGAEYETGSYSSWTYLHDHDVPCVVCRIPRSSVLMVPGKNVCHDKFILEYTGYLMSNYYSYSASEFVCVDRQPEQLPGGKSQKDGKLFYFVEGVCGSLKCPPYVSGWELTCAVCSFSPGEE